MSNAKNKPAFAVVLAAVAIVAMALVACGGGGPIFGGASGASGGGAPEYFDIEVSISHLPDLDEPFTVTAKLKSFEMDETDAELWMAVSGAVYLGGEDRWHGPLKLGEEKTISATFAVVTEGNHSAEALANSTDLWAFQDARVRFHTTAAGSELGHQQSGPQARAIVPGEVLEVGVGGLRIVDTSLLLNTSATPRIEFVQSQDDVARLQADGLFPKELRYRWRQLNHMDFSRVFLIVYFDQMRPSPGYLPVFQGNFLEWDDGVLKGSFKTFSVPEQESVVGNPVSAVTMRLNARDVNPSFADIYPFEGPRSFELTIDDGPPMPVQFDFTPAASRQ